MSTTFEYFPVGNGDMTLITLDNGKKVLIDCNIRNPDGGYPDVAEMLRDRLLPRNSKKQLFVDAFIWTHPDEDHCKGIEKHFHLGPVTDWSEKNDKIVVGEFWSSPLVFKRANRDKGFILCDDAKSLNSEIKRRVKNYKAKRIKTFGENVSIIGNDEEKTDGIEDIVMDIDTTNNVFGCATVDILGPSPKSDISENEDRLGKNHSSIILNFKFSNKDNTAVDGNYLCGGDAEVECWEFLWDRLSDNKTTSKLKYNILLAPHHCSWHTLSSESWKDSKGKAKPSDKALNALKNTKPGAYIVASSGKINNDYNDPPCYGAKKEYMNIVTQDDCKGSFKCVDDVKVEGDNVPLKLILSANKVDEDGSDDKFSNSNNPPVAQVKDGHRYA
ncbi:ComEC/Rec2 family competence protein [Aeromonas hydrophila]|uniref:hypothetical protein n=1 Tax=Aeromonas hydrophila TaxID=644 RepID=UPI002B493304|nr:hypothetical protein [Aeromonas hydrophila]